MQRNIAVIDFGSSKTPLIKEILESTGVSAGIIHWEKLSSPPAADAMVLSGAPVLFTDGDPSRWLSRFSFLATMSMPVLGICFGHQLMGMLNGAHVYKTFPVRREEHINIIRKDGLFSGLKGEITFTEDHTEGITLPPGFDLLASSRFYPVEAMKHKSRPYYGVQFHPEASGENGRILLGNFARLAFS